MRFDRRITHKHKRLVQVFTRQLIKAGLIQRQPCAMCGLPNAQPHHLDYNQILDIEWLCQFHHNKEHGGEKSPRYLLNGGFNGQAHKNKLAEAAENWR